MAKDELTGLDYLFRPVQEVVLHPDFDLAAFRKMIFITKMNTEQIMELNLEEDNGRS